MSLGIIPELEWECQPRPGEWVVAFIDRDRDIIGLATDAWKRPTFFTSLEHVRHRRGLNAPEGVSIGDLVTVPEPA